MPHLLTNVSGVFDEQRQRLDNNIDNAAKLDILPGLKDDPKFHFDAESIPGVGFSILGSREGEPKIWETLTLSGHNSILGRDGVILKLNFSSGNVPA